MGKTRGLSEDFMEALQSGYLAPLVDWVRRDHTLDFQIRADEVHIYFRGGKIIGIKPQSDMGFAFTFERNYLGKDSSHLVDALPSIVDSRESVDIWLNSIPHLKQFIDFYFGETAEKNEREFQQLMVRENNYATGSNSSDYFIVDIEYVQSDGRADLIAFKWVSDGSKRKMGEVELALIEMKYGDDAMAGKSGLISHIQHMAEIARSKDALTVLQGEMLKVFQQKRQLGLVRFGSRGNQNEVNSFSSRPPEILLILAHHDPASTRLQGELGKLRDEDKEILHIATSNFFGYGLFEEAVYPYGEFVDRFGHNICSKPTKKPKST